MRRMVIAILLAAGPLAGLTGALAAGPSSAAAVIRSPRIAISGRLPSVVRIGQTLTVTGRTTGMPARTRIVLQGLRAKPWTTLARTTSTARHRFAIRWRVGGHQDPGPLELRVAALTSRRLLASTRPVAPGRSYTLVVPAGTYSLHATPTGEGCWGFGQATVKPGEQTVANAYCAAP